jgi:DNA-directed RNA polymerase subunit H (RpoH/RPB5)
MTTIDLLRRYHRSQTNMIKVLRYRGYTVPDGPSPDDFCSRYSQMHLSALKKDLFMDYQTISSSHLPKILVVWLNEPKLGANIRDLYDLLKDAKRALVVVDESVTPQARETIKSLHITEKIFIDVWTLDETMIFVPDHELVPKHRICSTQEKILVFDAYGLKNGSKIPRIKTDDIMVRYLGACKDQLLEITRPSETHSGQFDLTYRLVQ